MKRLIVLLLVFVIGIAHAETVTTPAVEFFATDSRGFSPAAKAVVMTDLSKMEPAAALITGKRQKGKWKMIPFETAAMKGTALSIYSATNPPVVKLPLKPPPSSKACMPW